MSKYLHFHCPDHFFIYDSRAVSGIKRLTGKLETLKTRLPSLGSYDPEYADFFERCERLSTEVAAKIGRQPNPRELDNVLLFHYAKSRTSHCTRAFDRG
ncbi:MAG TPA: hypothetical protein VFQ90_00145 [Stellaceae bacterium]|nr:hypothetical protein [Stellaceae bacterium]